MIRSPASGANMLRGFWYYALPSAALKTGRTVHRTLLGEAILIGRGSNGTAFALADTCPHRGTLLSRGHFDGREVECPYHGWRFAADGQCTAIPSQLPGQKPQAGDIRARTYPVAEAQGNIWVYVGDRPDNLPAVPEVPACGTRQQIHISRTFACTMDLAVTGLMDPAHGAFVHASSLWRRHRDVRTKEKAFSPAPLGWRMDRHTASSNARAYKLFLGGTPETEITYALPGIRIEHAMAGRYAYAGLTACTPVDETTTEVHHVMYWTVPGGAPLRALVRFVAGRFLKQDANAVEHMKAGLAFEPATMLVEDADQQTRWYFRLKREWLEAEAIGRPFENPITPTALRWRS